MANTYTQLYIQFVFAVENRISLIQPEWEDELFKYITGIVQQHKHKMIAINGMPDHIHIFLGLHPNQSISDIMRIVKGETSDWINTKKFTKGKFNWQSGYGAFSYRRRDLQQIYDYVMNQKTHHAKKSLRDEYVEMLDEFDIPFDQQYLFHTID